MSTEDKLVGFNRVWTQLPHVSFYQLGSEALTDPFDKTELKYFNDLVLS